MPENDGAEKYLIFRLPLRFNQKITEKEVSLTKDFFSLWFYSFMKDIRDRNPQFSFKKFIICLLLVACFSERTLPASFSQGKGAIWIETRKIFVWHIRIGTSHKIPGGNRMHGLQQKVFEQYYGNDSYMPHIFTAVPKLLLTSFLILVGSIKSKDPSLSQSPFLIWWAARLREAFANIGKDSDFP